MRRTVFDEDEEDERPAVQRADRELTLGTGTLLLLFFTLVLLCGLCFGVGFSLGERGAAKTAPATTASGAAMQPVARTDGKPSAAPSAVTAGTQPAAAPMADDLTTADADGMRAQPGTGQSATGLAATGQSAAGQVTTGPVATGPVATQLAEQLASGAAGRTVHAALPQTPLTAQQQAPAGTPRAALPAPASGGSFMVQVAAVSDPVDAQVLLDALRKRGYPVTLAHAATDRLMHVQVGPFATRAEALATRQKLLNDGYNALVK